MPGTQDTASSAKSLLKQASDSENRSLQLLAESYTLALRYGNEYMDENPIVGEPGSFILSKSREPGAVNSQLQNKAPMSSKRPVAPEIKTSDVSSLTKKISKGAEKSPVSPGAKDKKARRKSKAVSSGVTATSK